MGEAWNLTDDELETPGLTMTGNTEATTSAATSAQNSEVYRKRARPERINTASTAAMSPITGPQDAIKAVELPGPSHFDDQPESPVCLNDRFSLPPL